MNRVGKILMKRDGYTKEEAEREVENLTDAIIEAAASGDFDAAEDYLLDYGLELDYLEDLF